MSTFELFFSLSLLLFGACLRRAHLPVHSFQKKRRTKVAKKVVNFVNEFGTQRRDAFGMIPPLATCLFTSTLVNDAGVHVRNGNRE
jgi:hypothetical protein